MIVSDLIHYLSIGSEKQSQDVMNKLHSDILKKIHVAKYSRDLKSVIKKYYQICWKQFRESIASITYDGLSNYLSAFDKSIYMKHHPDGRVELDELLNLNMELLGLRLSPQEMDVKYERFSALRNRALTLVIESCILYSSGIMISGRSVVQEIIDTLWLAERVTELARLSDTDHYYNGLEYFEVKRNGSYDFSNRPTFAKNFVALQSLFAVENRDITNIYANDLEPEENIAQISNRFEHLDAFYLKTQGFTLTESIEFLGTLLSDRIDCFELGEQSWVCMLKEDEFIQRLQEKTTLEKHQIRSILKFFAINSGKLRNNPFPNWRYPREVTILQQPLIQLKIDKIPSICYIPNLIKQSLGLQLAYPTGIIDRSHGDKTAEAHKHEMTSAFEKEIAEITEKFGFETISNINTPPGEIDAIAYHQESRILIMIECKAPKVHLDIKFISSDIKKLQKWIQKLKKKGDYVHNNLSSLHGTKNWTPHRKPILVIVTQRPTPQIKDKEIQVLHILQMEEWIQQLIDSA